MVILINQRFTEPKQNFRFHVPPTWHWWASGSEACRNATWGTWGVSQSASGSWPKYNTHTRISIYIITYIYISYIYIYVYIHIFIGVYIYTRCFLLRMRFYYIKNYQRLFLSMCHICEHRWSCRRACEFLLFLRQKLHHVLGGGRSSESRSVGANKSPFLMGKPTISMAIFYRYVKLLEGNHH